MQIFRDSYFVDTLEIPQLFWLEDIFVSRKIYGILEHLRLLWKSSLAHGISNKVSIGFIFKFRDFGKPTYGKKRC